MIISVPLHIIRFVNSINAEDLKCTHSLKSRASSIRLLKVRHVDGENAKFGTPYVAGAKVVATVGSEVKGEKVKVYKFHRRKGYRRTQGHREQYTMITINKINA